MQGYHPHFPINSGKLWPDGVPVDIPRRVRTARREVDGSLASKERQEASQMVAPQRFYDYEFQPALVSDNQQQIINAILLDSLAAFESDPEEPADFQLLGAAFKVEVIDPGCKKWLSSALWEEKIDQLLEKSWDFELQLSNYIDGLIRKKALSYDANVAKGDIAEVQELSKDTGIRANESTT